MATEIGLERHRLTEGQKTFYKEKGYLIGLPAVYDSDGVSKLNQGYEELIKLLRNGEDEKEIREWHESSGFLYDICVNPQILDYVEDLLGPNFYLWASNFFAKQPLNKSKVGSLDDLRNALKDLKPNDPIALLVERDGTLGYVSFNLE